MADVRTLTVKVDAVDNASPTLDKISKSTDSLSKGIGDTLKKSTVALAGAFATVSGAIYTSINAFIESEDVVSRLEQTISSFTERGTEGVKQLSAEIQNYATELQGMSKFSDEAIISASQMLMQMGVGEDQIKRTTKLTLDLAETMQMDLTSAAKTVGMALAHPDEALGKLRKQGIFFSQSQEDVIKKLVETGKIAEAQKMVLMELGSAFEGQAAASAKTFGGQLTILKNTFDDLQETIGAGIVQQLTNLLGGMDNVTLKISEFNTYLKENQDILAGLVFALGALAVGLGVLLLAALAAAAGTTLVFVGAIGLLLAALGFAVGWIVANWTQVQATFVQVKDAVVGAIENITTTITDFITNIPIKITEFLTNLGIEWNTFWTETFPFAIGFAYGFLSTQIPAMVELIIQELRKVPEQANALLELFKLFVTTKITEVKTWINVTVPKMVADFIAYFEKLPQRMDEIFLNIKIAIINRLTEALQGVMDFGGKILEWVDKLNQAISNVLGKVKEGIEAGKKGFTSRQYGGYIPNTGLALLHEGEFVVSKDMMAGRSPVPSGITQTYNQAININPTLSGEPDWDLLGYKLNWILRNAR